MEKDDLILLPLGPYCLALSREEFEKAIKLGSEIVGTVKTETTIADTQDKLYTADQIAEMTQIPISWFLEQARQGKIPHVRAGKYVRFRMKDLIEALEIRPGHRASMAFAKLKSL